MSANLDIELLRTFHAILRFGRFLAAASHLNRSPSAVSTHVRRLEELAGGRLFERDGRGVIGRMAVDATARGGGHGAAVLAVPAWARPPPSI